MPSDPKFDRYQFDPAMRPGSFENELLGFHQESIFGEERLDPSEVSGFDVRSQRRSVRHDSEQFSDLEFVKLVLLSVFPRLQTNKAHRKRAAHWLKVIRLYWHCGEPVSSIAKATNKTENAINLTVLKIRAKAKQCTEAA